MGAASSRRRLFEEGGVRKGLNCTSLYHGDRGSDGCLLKLPLLPCWQFPACPAAVPIDRNTCRRSSFGLWAALSRDPGDSCQRSV